MKHPHTDPPTPFLPIRPTYRPRHHAATPLKRINLEPLLPITPPSPQAYFDMDLMDITTNQIMATYRVESLIAKN